MPENSSTVSKFCNLTSLPGIEVFALNKAYIEDNFFEKVNLGIGAYRTETGHPWVLPCVKKVELAIAEDSTLNHEYLPILGHDSFCKHAAVLALGDDNPALIEGRGFAVQTLSGTGSLRVAAEFLCRELGYTTFYYSDPTWENHGLVFRKAGFTVERTYRYWDSQTRAIHMEGFLQDLRSAPVNSVIILHACAHNPTGIDPTQEQWKEIAQVIQERDLFPLFDMAYQGFASGDTDRDAWAVRYFVSLGLETMICQSFAKNFGLYNERIGCLTFVVNNLDVVGPIKSQVVYIIRGMYSNPPSHGARIVATILGNTNYLQDWKDCIIKMSGRIREMRELLRVKLEALGTPGTWHHITKQIGMFSYSGLTPSQVKVLVNKYHIYLLRSGRINMCGLNHNNIDYVAKAIFQVVSSDSSEAKL